MLTYTNPIVQRDLQEICSRIDTAAFDGKTILVTGANSMLGTYMAYLFLYMADKLGLDVRTVVLTRSADKTRALYADFIGREYFGIIDSDITHAIAYDGPLDYIYHFAGNASPRFINTDPVGILQSNLTGTFNVMELAREKNARVIFASTREVYGALALPQALDVVATQGGHQLVDDLLHRLHPAGGLVVHLLEAAVGVGQDLLEGLGEDQDLLLGEGGEGALVVVAEGHAVLWAAPRLKSLLAFTSDGALLAAAVKALAAFVRAQLKREGSAAARRKLTVEHFNGRDVLTTPLADLLQQAGFVRQPDGMRLYINPF